MPHVRAAGPTYLYFRSRIFNLQSLHHGTRRIASLMATGAAALMLLLLGAIALRAPVARADTTDCAGGDALSTGSPFYAVQNSNARAARRA